MKRIVLSVLAGGLAGGLAVGLLAGTGPATAAPAGGKGTPARPAPAATGSHKAPAVAPSGLAKYQIVTASFVDAANTQSAATVNCPTGRKAISGGAVIAGVGVSENLNSSIPSADGSGWNVWINNYGGVNGSFNAYVVCASGVVGYVIVQGSGFADPPGLNETTQPSVSCPGRKVALGGGGYTTSGSNLISMAGSEPTSSGHTWFADFNNRSSDSTTDSAYAVCARRPANYGVVFGTEVNVAPGTQGGATATCPSGAVVLGGGGSPVVFRNAAIDLNSTAPITSSTWETWLNNNDSTTATLLPEAVCGSLG